MNKIRVLVLGVGGNVSLGIIKALALSRMDFYVVGACINTDSVGLYFCDKAYISPYANDKQFIQWVTKVCNGEKIDIVLTGVEEIILEISKNIDYFRDSTKSIFISTPYEKLTIGQDKLLTCEWLENNGCNFPKYCKPENFIEVQKFVDEVGFPLIAKPRCGKGSNGIIKIENVNDLKKVAFLRNYIIQEYIGTENEEYTIGCYYDKNGKLIDIIIMQRTLYNGSTQKAIVSENIIIREEAIKICNAFKPIGPLNIQMRIDSNRRAVCFELNVRFSGTTPMRANFGYNDVEAMIEEYVLNKDISNNFEIKSGIALRYTNEIYLTNDAYNKMNFEHKIDNVSQFNVKTDSLGAK